MSEPPMINRRAVITALPLLIAPLPGRAGTAHHRMSLLDGEFQDGVWLAGLDLQLDRGWKTYWRVPGDSGVPPSFDWSRSSNVASIEMRWPAPRRYHDAAGETIGYSKRVVFPLRVVPADAAQPVVLALDAFFAVCNNICIPAKANLERRLEADAGAASLIAAHDARVPAAGAPFRRAALAGAGGPALRLEPNPGWDPTGMDVFVEGLDRAYFRAPRPAGDAFVLPIDGVQDQAALRGKALKLTLVTDQLQLEQTIAVD